MERILFMQIKTKIAKLMQPCALYKMRVKISSMVLHCDNYFNRYTCALKGFQTE